MPLQGEDMLRIVMIGNHMSSVGARNTKCTIDAMQAHTQLSLPMV